MSSLSHIDFKSTWIGVVKVDTHHRLNETYNSTFNQFHFLLSYRSCTRLKIDPFDTLQVTLTVF